MPGDTEAFKSALKKWDRLINSGKFSVSSEVGKTAILYCAVGIDDYEEELEAFQDEAYHLADQVEAENKEALIVHDFTNDDMCDIAQDESVSDVIIIGNGTLSSVETSDGMLGWKNIAKMSQHLKTGSFIQRQCGNTQYNFSPPLGTFLMSRHDRIYAAFGHILPVTLASEHEASIKKIHNHPRLTLELARGLFSAAYGYDSILD